MLKTLNFQDFFFKIRQGFRYYFVIVTYDTFQDFRVVISFQEWITIRYSNLPTNVKDLAIHSSESSPYM